MALENDPQITRLTRAYTLSFLILLCCIPSPAQQAGTVTFTLDFHNSEPDHYVISVSSDGHATYESNGKLSPDAQGDAFHLDFALSPATRARITGVGFFDKVHGQTGVAQLNGIELHPVLKVEFL